MLRGSTKSVIFDPFKGVGLPEPKAKADIVLCSHSHSDHNNAQAVRHENSIVLEGFTGTKLIDSISIKGIATFHDEAGGSKRGRNSVYAVGLEGLAFCHLGDLGQELSASQVSDIGLVDVLFAPVGGFYTVGPEQARRVMESLKPRITVPMHYRLPGMSGTFNALSTVEDFVHEEDTVRRLSGSSFIMSKGELPEKPTIIIPRLI